jgi:hypothetical protein
VAALLLALALLAVGGSGILISFGLDAAAARAAEANATAQQAELEKQQAQERERLAQEALEKDEDTLVENLLLPLGYEPGEPTPAELEALQLLAQSRSERVRLRFLEEGLRHPETAKRLGRRCALAVQATVGLSRERRDAVGRLLRSKLGDGTADRAVREACVLLGAALGTDDSAFCREAAQAAVEIMAETTEPTAVAALAQALESLAPRLTPEEAGRLSAAAIPLLLDAMVRTTSKGNGVPPSLTRPLGSLVARLAPEQAAAVTQKLLAMMSKPTDDFQLSQFAPVAVQVLGSVAARLNPEEAGRLSEAGAQLLLDAMARTSNWVTRDSLAHSLESMLARSRQEQAAATARKLLDAMGRTTDASALATLGQVLGSLAARLSPEEAGRLSAAATPILLDAMARTPTNLVFSDQLAQALGSQTALPPEQAAAAAQRLLDALAKTSDANTQYWPVKALGPLAARLPPEQAAAAAQALLAIMARTTDPTALNALVQALRSLAARLKAAEAGRLSATVAQMLLDAMARNTDPDAEYGLAQALGSLAAGLPPEQAAAAARKLLDVMAKARNGNSLTSLAGALGSLAARLRPDEASRLSADAAQILLDVMARSTDATSLRLHAQALGRFASRLPPEQAGVCAQKLLDVMARTTEANDLAMFASGVVPVLGSLAAQLKPEDASRLSAAVAQVLLDAMARPTAWFQLSLFAEALGSFAARLPPDQAAAAALKTLEAMAREPDQPKASENARALAALGARLGPDGLVALLKQPACTGEARGIVLRELARRLGPPAPQALSSAVAAVAAAEPRALTATALTVHDELVYPGGRRPFADLWEAVDWIHNHHPDLDLTFPPEHAGR